MTQFLERKTNQTLFSFSQVNSIELQSQVEKKFQLKQEMQVLKRKLSVGEKGTDDIHISNILVSQANIDKIERENSSLLNQVKELTEVICKFKS